MVRDKKGKSEGKKAKAAEKKAKQEKKNAKKTETRSKKARADDSDAEDVDLDAVLAEFAKKQETYLKVTETTCEPPRARSSSTFVASPENENELFVFGGEYFNGALVEFFNDLYVYIITKDEWRVITSPNTPLPRSGHAWCRGGNAGGIYLFGGEFSSPKQGTFYHYNDFWRLDPSTREWSRIESKGKWPPARSGHRMTYYKNYIVLFGGFQDTSQQTKYLADLWLYDTQSYVWYNPTIPLAIQKPDARSSFSFLPHEAGAVLYGGYSRVKTTTTTKQAKGGGQAQRNVLKPLIHQDCFFLRITQPPAQSQSNAPPTVRWERRKKPQNAPNPPRAGATMVYHKGRGISFGGVHDIEEDEEGIDSEFFNQLFAWNIERNRYFPLLLRRPRKAQRKVIEGSRGPKRGRGQADEEELLRNLAALHTGQSLAEVMDISVDRASEENQESEPPLRTVSLEYPPPRFNAQLAVQNDVLYIFGGTMEKGDREFTFDELHAIDLGKLDGFREIFRRDQENWFGNEESEDDDEGDDASLEEDEETETDEEGDVHVLDNKPVSLAESKLKVKALGAGEDVTTDSVSVFDDIPDDAITKLDDGLPHPRPFEARRDFFQRTGVEWQEALMSSLRWKGIQPEILSVKEIKAKAYEMCEEKWWDCREEIVALEDEQEAAGISEIVALSERAGGDGVGPRRR